MDGIEVQLFSEYPFWSSSVFILCNSLPLALTEPGRTMTQFTRFHKSFWWQLRSEVILDIIQMEPAEVQRWDLAKSKRFFPYGKFEQVAKICWQKFLPWTSFPDPELLNGRLLLSLQLCSKSSFCHKEGWVCFWIKKKIKMRA